MFLNVGLVKHPLNWLTVWSMLLLAAIAGHFALKWFNNPTPESEEE